MRGGTVFNALNEPPADPQSRDFLGPVAKGRREPYVAALLEHRYDDAKAAAYVLTLPLNVILRVHERVSQLVKLEDVQRVAAARVTSSDDRWRPPLPPWMAPLVADRLLVCEDDEALDLYAWLQGQPLEAHKGDLFEIAVERFTKNKLERAWHVWVGAQLPTGKAWKSRGAPILQLCVDWNIGFSPQMTAASLQAATERDGAGAEEHRAAIIRSLHDIAAKIFVERADGALRAGDRDWARRLLEALMSLDPGSFVSGAIRRLREVPDLPADVAQLIDGCEQLSRSGGRQATEDGFHEAFLVLMGRGR